ncbi:hypothetical protein [Heterobasidion ambi-like virus 1]|nr:hypothetical protein [Heterobasidion ambi-like virus 1]
MWSGIVINAVLAAPMPEEMVEEMRKASKSKETKVMEDMRPSTELDYSVWFDPSRHHESMHWTMAPNPPMARKVKMVIDQWISTLENGPILYPTMSTKKISRNTVANLSRDIDTRWADPDLLVDQTMLEELYHESGYKAYGVVEMRQRWYTSGLGPRTYFAAGGTAYHASKYLQQPFNLLCELFDPTHRINRVNPQRLVIDEFDDDEEPEDPYIYDLTTFTSNMAEQVPFLYKLSEYCRGHIVYVLDSYAGCIEQDLGEMLWEYAEYNNKAEYEDLSQGLGEYGPFLQHGIAGFLGVHGNIASCMFLHGAVMLQGVRDTSKLNIAGDDGIVITTDREKIFRIVRLLGLMEESKAYVGSEPGAIALKRPISVDYENLLIVTARILIWPSFERFAHAALNPPDIRLGPLDKPKDRIDAIHRFSAAVLSMFRHLRTYVLDPPFKDFLKKLLQDQYGRFQIPLYGSVPQFGGDERMGFITAVSDEAFCGDPITYTIDINFRGKFKGTRRDKVIVDTLTGRSFAGSTFSSNSTPLLRFLKGIRYVSAEKETIDLEGESALWAAHKEFGEDRFLPPVYTYIVLKDIPPLLFEMTEMVEKFRYIDIASRRTA